MTADQFEAHQRWKTREVASREVVNTDQCPSVEVPAVLPIGATVGAPITIVLPWPPSVNHSSGQTAGGGRYLTPEHKRFRGAVASIVAQLGSPCIHGRLRVAIVLFPADRRRFDLDNRIKATLDALQRAGVFADDEQVDALEITRVRDTKRGEALVTINRIAA